MAVARKKKYTPEEYLELDKHSEIRNEFVDGEIYEKLGGTTNRKQLIEHVVGALSRALVKRPAYTLALNLQLHVSHANTYLYPDVMVIKGTLYSSEQSNKAVTNPILIFEVPSDLRHTFDRRKFNRCRMLDSLREYVVIAPHFAFVERFQRIEDGQWAYEGYGEMKDALCLQSVKVEIPLEVIYEGVSVEKEER